MKLQTFEIAHENPFEKVFYQNFFTKFIKRESGEGLGVCNMNGQGGKCLENH